MIGEIADERRDEMVEYRQQRAQPVPDASVGRDIVAMRVPGAGSGMIAEVDGDETHARLDEPAGQQRLPAPIVFAIALDDFGRLVREVECRLGASACDDVEGLLGEAVEGFHAPAGVEIGAQSVHLLCERPAFAQPVHREPGGELKEPVDVVPVERIEPVAQVAAPRHVRLVF